jgi:hypothetical protein
MNKNQGKRAIFNLEKTIKRALILLEEVDKLKIKDIIKKKIENKNNNFMLYEEINNNLNLLENNSNELNESNDNQINLFEEMNEQYIIENIFSEIELNLSKIPKKLKGKFKDSINNIFNRCNLMIKDVNIYSDEEFGLKLVEEMCNFIEILIKFNSCLDDEGLIKKCEKCKN